jgi:hypothetical protein
MIPAPPRVKSALWLAGEGAAVLIAESTRRARRGQEYGNQAAIPVIVLSFVRPLEPDGFVFSVGSDPKAEAAALDAELRAAVGACACRSRGRFCSALPAAGASFPVQLEARSHR